MTCSVHPRKSRWRPNQQQYQRLKELASKRSISIAQLVHEGVDHVLPHALANVAWDRFLSAAGSFHAQGDDTDVAANHDRYLEDAFR